MSLTGCYIVMSRPEESARELQTDVCLCGWYACLEGFYVVAPDMSVTCQVIYGLRGSTGVSAIDMPKESL